MDEEEEIAPKRKVFIQNVGGFIGGNLSKKFAADGFEVIGTLKSTTDPKPLAVSRVVASNADMIAAAFLESDLTVIDCLGDMETAETLLTAIAVTGPLESEKVLVGISSVLTWARTSPDADEPEKPITEADYKKRRPHSSYKELLALEKLVTKSKREGLRTHVVAAGLVYGAEEDIFHELFKAAWSNKPLPLHTLNDGSNVLPTIHITDLCSIAAKLLEGDSLPYLLAVDSPSEEAPQTLAAIIQALSTELGTGTLLPAPPRQEVLLVPDYEFFQVGTAIGDTPGLKLQAAAVNDLGFEWHAQGGFLAHMPAAVQEYRESRGLQPLRVLVHGNDEVAKTELTETLAHEYKLPFLHATKVLDAAALVEDELGAELVAARAAGPVPDELTAKVVGAALSTTECRNQGYILHGFPENLAQASLIFGGKKEVAEGEEAPPEEGEEGAEASKSLAAAPEFVVVLEADEAVIKQKLFAQPEPSTTEEQLTETLAAYAANNSEDSPTSVLALPGLAEVEPLGPLEVLADTAASSILSKVRVYLGQPRNYGPSDEEIAAKKALEEAEAKRKADEAAAAEAAREAAQLEERKRREAHESRRAAEVQQQEHELLEVRSMPLRNYLMQNVIPTLTEGLIEVCKLKPEDPVDYLAEYLFKNNPVEDEQFE